MSLRELDLTWTISGEVLLITTPEEAESLLVTRFYDVTDLACAAELLKGAGPRMAACVRLGETRLAAVRGEYRVHEEIERLLAELRRVAKE